MTDSINHIKHFIKTSDDYQFLTVNSRLKENTILLTLSGSLAYGTNVKNSDIDLRGICLESTYDLLGLQQFDQYEDRCTDTVIYGLKKFIKLCLNNNPNILELLATKDEHIILITKEGQLLRDNIHLFLSKKIIKTYGHYAENQIRKLRNASLQAASIHESDQKLNELITQQLNDFNTKHDNITLKTANKKSELISKDHLYFEIQSKEISYIKLSNTLSEANNIVKLIKRKKTKPNQPQTVYKTAMHILRLLQTGQELLEGKGLQVYRDKDRVQYINIRNGNYSYDELFKMIEAAKLKFNKAAKHTDLPELPDYDAVEQLMLDLYKSKLRPSNEFL